MGKIVASYGLLEVSVGRQKVHLHYAGNMGATLDQVKDCVDHLYGVGAYAALMAHDQVRTEGSPDYSWVATVPYDAWELIKNLPPFPRKRGLVDSLFDPNWRD